MRASGFTDEALLSELVAAPLASEAAFRAGLVELDPELADPATAALWRETERELLARFSSVSIDELVNLRDHLWFARPPVAPPDWQQRPRATSRQGRRIGLRQYLDALPPKLACWPQTGGVDRRDAAPSPAAAQRWLSRWLSFSLPLDLVAPDGGPGAPESPSPELARLLADQGYAQSHCHIGAAFSFDGAWAGLLCLMARPGALRVDQLASPGAAFGEGRHLMAWLLRAALLRFALADYVTRYPAREVAFETHVTGAFAARCGDRSGYLMAAFEEVACAQARGIGDCRRFARLTECYRRLVRSTSRRGRLGDGLAARDPLWESGFGGAPGRVDRDLAHQLEPGDRFADRCLWQTLRLRTIFYRHLVQRPGTPGLAWFVRHFARIGPVRPWRDGQLLDSALALDGLGCGLRSLEVRTTPRDFAGLRSLAAAINLRRSHEGGRVPACEVGLVLHFAKDRGGKHGRGLPASHWRDTHARPTGRRLTAGRRQRFRYGAFYLDRARQAQELARTVWACPHLGMAWRGLDLCTDEQGVPTWVLAPLVRFVRHEVRAVRELLAARAGVQLPRSFTTVHAGEDFLHAASGLRRVAEAIELLELGEGDRIGHGTVLGLDLEGWAARAGYLQMAVEERLLDLVWEWQWWQAHPADAPGEARIHVLHDLLERLGSRLFGEHACRANELAELIARLGCEHCLLATGFPYRAHPRDLACPLHRDPGQVQGRRLFAYLRDPALFDRGRELCLVDTAQDLPALESLQRSVRRLVSTRGLAIEINPSSNLLIGGLTDLRRHPLWRLNPPVGDDLGAPLIPLVVGSDDPLTFATNLREEFQLLLDALVRSGLAPEVALAWVDRARAAGLRFRFTTPWQGWEDCRPRRRGSPMPRGFPGVRPPGRRRRAPLL